MRTPRISLDQWAAFKAVVDAGSFALAAEALNKSQSSVSYAIARLQEQLPRPVLLCLSPKPRYCYFFERVLNPAERAGDSA